MPREIRNIIFSTNEVLFAVKDCRQRLNDGLPPGSIIDCKILDEPEIGAEIEIACEPDGRKRIIAIEGQELTAAMILFCVNLRIPLPAHAIKILQLIDGELGLIVTMFPGDHHPVEIKPAVAPVRTSRLKRALYRLGPGSDRHRP